jgi:class 3 adenylate cyclase
MISDPGRSVRAHRVYQTRLVRVRSCKTGQGNLIRVAIHLGTERTRAAILFADLSGFTALVESSRPETVYRRIRPIMDELVSVVTEHGGDIQQVLGDGFMAVFGLRAQRADAGPYSEPVEHAVRAAIALVRAGADLRGDFRCTLASSAARSW